MDSLNHPCLNTPATDFKNLGALLAASSPLPTDIAALVPQPHLLPLFRNVAALLGEVIQADLTGAAELLENGTLVSRSVGAGVEGEQAGQTLAYPSASGSASSLSTYALRAGNVITSAEIAVDGRFNDEFLRDLGVRSAVCVPLRAYDKTIGTLEFYRFKKQPFIPADVQLIEVVSRQLGVLVRQIRDEQAAQVASQSESRKQGSTSRQGAEARTSPRRKYPYRQMIAPVVRGRSPTREEFFPVWCKDLSGGGFSIYLENPPTFHHLIVALGLPPHVKFCRAEAMHVQPVEVDGRRIYLVGCRFTSRVYL